MTEVARTLIVIPIAHTEEDMGSLGGHLPVEGSYRRIVRAGWAEIQRQVQALALDWSKVKVYQDGLPDADPGIIRKILSDVRSPNYDLLRWLAAQGTELVGTESPALIKEEYDHIKAVYTAEDAEAKAKARRAYEQRASALLAERDGYIARRIAETLPAGGIGLLFIGQAHQVTLYLPADTAVRELPRRGTTTPARNARTI